MVVDGQLADLADPIDHDAKLEFIARDDPRALDMIRHDAAHVMAEAVQSLWPGTQVTIGPVIENGFYYDFFRNEPFTLDDLPKIEAKMMEIVARNTPFTKEVWSREDAKRVFSDMGEMFKVELVDAIPAGEPIKIYRQGEWFDLCRGPHMASTGQVGTAFKLQKVAGAYWRGDSRNEMLQRIYGTAWAKNEEQDAYLKMLEEADKRDHRKLGRELDLFHMQEEAPGLIFWHPKGWTIWQQVEQYMRRVYQDNGYQEVRAPQILDRALWERSGHWDKYRESMFTTESENRAYALKPMNCPGHLQIYNANLHSYRELPLRYGEFGACHRNEPSGALHGMMRVRGFTQDDGHIFCTEEQILDECVRYTALLQKVYRDFGFNDILYRIALRPEQRIGSDESWDRAEEALKESLRRSGVEFALAPGEGAFYGPKIEYTLKDALGRPWQCGTMQVDFQMPGRLGAEYVAEDNSRKVPVMLHRAIVGSLERFIGMLIEHFAGAMPPWLAPAQVAVANISEAQAAYAAEVAQALKKQGLRAEADLRNEKITYKIRALSLQKIPYIVVVGDKEMQAKKVAVRARGGVDLGVMSGDEFAARLLEDVAQRRQVGGTA
jgi:threonyl-tRNA synthetase